MRGIGAGLRAAHGDAVALTADIDADRVEHVEEGAEVLGGRASQGDLAPGDGSGHGEGAGLDTVGHGVVGGTAQPAAALDLDDVRGGALDICAHRLQQADEVVDLRLAGGRADGGVAVGQRGRQHGVLRAHDGDVREDDVTAAQPSGRLREVVAVAVVDGGAQRLHGLARAGPPAGGRCGRHQGC